MICQNLFLSLILLTLPSRSLAQNDAQVYRQDDGVSECQSDVAQDEVAFFKACVNGIMDVLKAIIEIHPKWVHKVTKDGEHCLHLAAIKGQTEVTTYMLQQGADPNVRSTFSAGLRMHPLSWNVYRGNYENVKVLLDGGANVNLDFDDMGEEQRKVTVLDISTRLVKGTKAKGEEDVPDKFDITHQYLLTRGAKHYMEIEMLLNS